MMLHILSARPEIYSTKRLRQEAELLGVPLEIINYNKCTLGIGSSNQIIHKGRATSADIIIPRIGNSSSQFGAALVRQYGLLGAKSTTQPGAILRARDKFATIQALSKAGIKVPDTAVASTPDSTESLLSLVEGAPIILKLLEGTHGKGVILAETKKAAESLLAAFYQLDADIFIQNFIKEANGTDIRAFVVNGKVVASMLRRAAPGEYRANLHQGATAESITLTDEEEFVAIESAKAVGLDVAGVDMLRTSKGPLVLEINVSPGLEGIEATSGVNVASHIIQYAISLL